MAAEGTRPAASDFLSGGGEMGALIRDFRWAAHPLGDPEGWSASLKTSVSLILNSQHPMWIGWGREMSFLYNDAYLHVLGHAKHPWALGRPAPEVWAEIWDVCGPLAEKVFREGQASFVDDVRLFMNRGDFLEETYYSFSYSPIRDEEGTVRGLFCPSTDVTPKVLNARRLRTLSALSANALLEKTTAAACRSAAETLARNPDDVPFALLYLVTEDGARAALEQTVHLNDEDGVLAPRWIDLRAESVNTPWPVAEVLRVGQPQSVSVERFAGLPHGPADQPVAEAVVLPVTAATHGKPVGVLVAGVNPTRRRDADYQTFFQLVAGHVGTVIQNARAAEEERKRADMLAELDRAKTTFFSNVSHEFRTPLTLMLGPLENLLGRDGSFPAEDREQLATAYRNSLRLLKLVNSLLDFSRIEAGRMKASYTAVDLAALTSDLASNFRSAMQAGGLELVVDCPPLPQPVYVDREMWEKVVLNLLSNAFKFTFNGSVRVSLKAEGSSAVLTVADTGVGISQHELPNVFKRFHRVEGARGRTYEGTGIGLALTQELVKLHGGTVEARSRPGEGSTFTVTLPFGSRHLPQDRLDAAAQVSTAVRVEAYSGEALTWISREGLTNPCEDLAAPAVSYRRPGEVARILVADDNADMREHLSHILAPRYELTTAADGLAALEAARRNRPDLILSDVMMPGLDGYSLLRELRADEQLREIPVILLSARAGEEARTEGIAAGADDYLTKPFNARELTARVRTALDLHRLRRSAREELARSEERYRSIVNQSVAGIAEVLPDGTFIMVNDQYCRITGYSREELFSRRMQDLTHPDDLPRNLELFRRAVERHEGFEIHKRYVRSDGSDVWVHNSVSPVADAGGTIRSIVAIVVDVTLHKRAEEALRESEQRFRNMADSAPVIVWMTERDGTCTYLNRRWYEFTGQSEEASLGFGWLDAVHPEDRAESDRIFREASARHEAFRLEYRLRRLDGVYRWAIDAAAPRFGAEGEFLGYVGSVLDITDRRLVEEELRRTNADLEQFAYSASHDLQEPLRSIKIYSELLASRHAAKLDGQALQYLEFLRSGATRMELLVRDLLAYTQAARSDKPASLIDSGESLNGALANLSEAVAESGARITWEPLPRVRVHPTQLQQVFQNLLGNAIKYRSPDRTPAVHVGVTPGEDLWRFSVADNGIGIAPEYKERIFGLFKRLHTAREYPGTGIGLAICQRIVEHYHGRIWVESEPGTGSTFFFTIPA